MNVIVVMLDTLRYDHLGCYGNPWIRTPNIDSFSREAFIFNRAYAEGLPTLPVRATLFTGMYTLPFRGWQPLEPSDVTLAEYLWDKGVRTALISDTYNMHKPGMAYERGFDYVEWIRGQEMDPYIIDDIEVDLSKWHEKNWTASQGALFSTDLEIPVSEPLTVFNIATYGAIEQRKKNFVQYLKNTAHWRDEGDQFIAQVVKAGMRWLEGQVREGRRDRLFLWLDSFDPHEPWNPPEEYYRLYAPRGYSDKPIIYGGGSVSEFTELEIRHMRAQYAGKVTLVDKWVGIFLEKVKELGLWDNTAIILISDHGVPIGEHGIIRKVKPWPYEELSRIVLLIRHPQLDGGGKKINAFVETVDIMPTILDIFGIKYDGLLDGESLLPLMRGEKESIRDSAISGFYRRSWSLRYDKYSLYLWLDKKRGNIELYEVNFDYTPPKPDEYDWRRHVAERENICDKEKELAKELEEKLRNRISSITTKHQHHQIQ